MIKTLRTIAIPLALAAQPSCGSPSRGPVVPGPPRVMYLPSVSPPCLRVEPPRTPSPSEMGPVTCPPTGQPDRDDCLTGPQEDVLAQYVERLERYAAIAWAACKPR